MGKLLSKDQKPCLPLELRTTHPVGSFRPSVGTWVMLEWRPPKATCFPELLGSYGSTGGETEAQRDKVTDRSQDLNPGLYDPKAHTPLAPTSLDPGGGK